MSMRKALFVGVENYEYAKPLSGCVLDALSLADALKYNYDGTRNFEVRQLLAPQKAEDPVTGSELAEAIDWLFGEGDPDIAMFFFSGHGAFDGKRGYLCPSDYHDPHSGVPMEKLIEAAADSKARNKIIVLDCCHSGATGVEYFSSGISSLPENTVIMAGCTKEGYSVESRGRGVFTRLFEEALNGAGCNILGEVSPGSVYAHIDKSLGAFEQRPVFKANVRSFICLKRNKPLIAMDELRKLPLYFETPDFQFPLDPTYEEDKNHSENKERNEEHEQIFRLLRKYWRAGLVRPVGEEYMYWAAVHSTGCRLTALGEHYWHLLWKGVL